MSKISSASLNNVSSVKSSTVGKSHSAIFAKIALFNVSVTCFLSIDRLRVF